MKLFDTTLARLERSLDVHLARHNLLSGNLANADTPSFRPKDVDFKAAMAAADKTEGANATFATLGMATTKSGHIPGGAEALGGSGAEITTVEVGGDSPSIDDNRVDLDRTMASLAENSLQYGASARAAGKKLAILRYVVSDGQG
jgi:flagellar basal-body rod protein FlgB